MMASKLKRFYLFRWGLFWGSCHCPNCFLRLLTFILIGFSQDDSFEDFKNQIDCMIHLSKKHRVVNIINKRCFIFSADLFSAAKIESASILDQLEL